MSRQVVLRAQSGRRRAGRITASAMMGFALVGALLAGPPSAAQAAAPRPDCVDLAAASFAVSAPGRDDTLPAGSTGRCYQFDQPAGSTLKITADRTGGGFE